MSFDITRHCSDQAWLQRVSALLDQKMRFSLSKAREVDYIPYSTKNGQWKPTDIQWWTNGFWGASMWQMYLATGDSLYREEAIRGETMLDPALAGFKDLSHDVGFMWLLTSGIHYQLEQDPTSYDRTLFAANTLAGRFNPNGFLRAWNGKDQAGWAIVDCMMNLPLLYWASAQTGDPRYKLIATAHADTTLRTFLRADGSSNHIVIFDPETGDVLDNPAGQGSHSGSSWSRGQAWALYGFTLSYLHTGKQAYLDAAKRSANYFISQITDDYIPRCDFRQPNEPVLKDNAAGNIAACGLLELCQLVPESEALPYYQAALKILKAQEAHCANWTEDDPAIFTQCTTAYHDLQGRHITMHYADYFFIEAIGKLRGEKLLLWYPHRKDPE